MTVFAVMVTYRRPGAVHEYLEVLVKQTIVPDHVVIVDNGADPAVHEVVARARARGLSAAYLAASENLGPSGGFALGLAQVLDRAGDDDWVVLLDDDDPPFADDLLEVVVGFAEHERVADHRLAGVGLTGARIDRRRARVVRYADGELRGTLAVDLIGGGQLPCYSIGAIRRAGVPDPSWFWGFEELAFADQLRAAGYVLRVSGELALRCREHYGRLGTEGGQPDAGGSLTPWRRYYTTRNLIAILRSSGNRVGAMRLTLTRVVKDLLLLARRRPGSRALVSMTVRGVRDGWTGRLGRTVDPP